MEIGQYIVDLLRGQNEVNVPGLGTFTKIRLAGYFDESSNSFFPPTFRITFKESKENDSSLIEFIARKEGKEYTEIEKFIKNFCSTISSEIKNENEFKISELGIFKMKAGCLHFEEFERSGFDENILKLSPIKDLEIKKEEVSSTTIETENKGEKIEIDSSKSLIDEDIPEVDEHEENAKPRSWIKIFLVFVAFLAALLALFYLNTDFNAFIKNKSVGLFNTGIENQKENSPLIDSTKINADSISNQIDSASILADSLRQVEDSSIEVENDTLSTIQNNENIRFEIISAAFNKKSEAEDYIIQLGKKGIQAKIVENMPGKMLKISLGTFLDEESAKVELRRIHKEVNKEAWIAKIEPNKKSK